MGPSGDSTGDNGTKYESRDVYSHSVMIIFYYNTVAIFM